MRDEFNNECSYDFKNIQFIRYAVTSTTNPLKEFMVYEPGVQDIKYSLNTTLNECTVDAENGTYFYTFSYVLDSGYVQDLSIVGNQLPNDESEYSGVFNNKIADCGAYYLYSGDSTQFRFALPNNVIVNTQTYVNDEGAFFGCYSNTFGRDCHSNTLGNNCSANTLSDNCHSNTFGYGCCSNTLGNDCSTIMFEYNCQSNIFEDTCYTNTLGNSCSSNTFGYGCRYNTLGDSCHSNTLRNDCSSNALGDKCSFNTLGNDCFANTWGNNCSYNVWGNNCNSNTLEDNCSSNT